MTEEQRERERERKRLYRERKRTQTNMTLGDKCLLDRQIQSTTDEQREQMASQIAQANGIIITEKDNITDLEKQFKDAAMREPQPILPTPRDRAKAILAEAEERQSRVELIMSQYQKDACNTNALLWHLLETFTLMRLELTDLIGSLRK